MQHKKEESSIDKGGGQRGRFDLCHGTGHGVPHVGLSPAWPHAEPSEGASNLQLAEAKGS